MNAFRMIVLAAGQGSRLRPLTDQVPKCMVPLHGKPLVHWQLQAARACGVSDIVIVGGYRANQLPKTGVTIVENRNFESTNMVVSLFCADAWFGDRFVMGYGDIVYNSQVLTALLESPQEISVVVDRAWQSYWAQRTDDILGDAESLRIDAEGRICSIGQKVGRIEEIQGQYIGLVAFRSSGIQKMRDLVERERAANQRGQRLICPQRSLDRLFMTDLLQGLVNAGAGVWPVWVDGGWLEIDTLTDLELASKESCVLIDHLTVRR